MKLIAYARASTEDQKITLADQQEKLWQYAALYEHEIVEMVVGSESAKTIDDRDEFQRVLQMLRDGVADGLLVLKVDRLARDVGDGAQLLKLYFGDNSKYNKYLFGVLDYIDTRTANGRMIFNMQLVIAQWERETIAERTKAALKHLRKNGRRVGNVLFGFTLAADGKTLTPFESEQETIRLMHQWRAAGMSLRAIAGKLNDAGRSSQSGRPWSATVVRRILNRSN